MAQLTCRVTATNAEGEVSVLSAPAVVSAPGVAWSPAELFAAGEAGAWYDAADLSTLWQDTAGTVPVTADGDIVARWDDKSGNGNHAIQPTAAARPVFRVTGGPARVVFDGVDDFLPLNGAMIANVNYSVNLAWTQEADPMQADQLVVGGNSGGNNQNLHIGWSWNDTLKFDQWFNGITWAQAWDASPRILSAILRTGERLMRVGGVQRVSSANTTKLGAWNGAAFGSRRSGEFYSPSVHGAVFRAGDMSDAQAADVEAYLAGLAGVTL